MAVAGQATLLQGVSVIAVLAALAVRSGRVELTVRAVTSVSSLLVQRLVEVAAPRHPVTITRCKIKLNVVKVSFHKMVRRCFELCSHQAWALTLLNRVRTQLNFHASVDADADAWCEWRKPMYSFQASTPTPTRESMLTLVVSGHSDVQKVQIILITAGMVWVSLLLNLHS